MPQKTGSWTNHALKASDINLRLHALGDRDRVPALQRYFKTGPGEYGAGDQFVGLRVPQIRALAKEYQALPLSEIIHLLQSSIHEARLLALLILVHVYTHADDNLQGQIFRLYLGHSRFINNWDLVDVSAEHIVGPYLRYRSRAPLRTLAGSDLLWDRRISIMATFHFIKQGEYDETLQIAGLLLGDPHDLIHKAVGWMLREIGKRAQVVEEAFLKQHYPNMPRTMLRYAIEKFPTHVRQLYLQGKI